MKLRIQTQILWHGYALCGTFVCATLIINFLHDAQEREDMAEKCTMLCIFKQLIVCVSNGLTLSQ